MPDRDWERIERQLTGPERATLDAWARACGCHARRVPGVQAYLETVAILREADVEARISRRAPATALLAACRRYGVRVRTFAQRLRRW